MVPSIQKALVLQEKFGKLVVDIIPVQKPSHGEILVKVHAAALNPVDWKVHRYGIFVQTFPAILGTDIAGEVEEVGEGVTDFKQGDRV
jgi:NADPH:quinone reductase-like Zn-dependent oxidoreductase